MPNPMNFDNQDEWMKVCMRKLVGDEGKEQDQAAAICMSMWEKRGDKQGSDKPANDKPEGKQADETFVIYGDAVKALGGGKIGGYLVRFSTDADPDLEGEFFTKDTDFGETDAGVVYYQHGMDAVLGKRRIGKASHKTDDFGVWAEAQLDLRDRYEKFIYEMAEKGKLGWSSGTAGHLVEREPHGKAVWLKTWPLGLDDTLTPTPAEPRNAAVPLKSWQPADAPALPQESLVERIDALKGDASLLLSDLRELVGNIDRPLSGTKRSELQSLLESCSGLDAVRHEMQSILTAGPQPKLTDVFMVKRKLAEYRRQQNAD